MRAAQDLTMSCQAQAHSVRTRATESQQQYVINNNPNARGGIRADRAEAWTLCKFGHCALLYILYRKPFFVVAKTVGSPGKSSGLLFISNFLKV